MAGELEFLVLGPFEILSGGSPLRLASRKQRTLLALLLLRANEVVSSDRLIDELWAGKPPESAANVLQVHVSQLRKQLEPGLLVTRAPGYVLQVDPSRIDRARFERLLDEGMAARAAGDLERALATLEDALELWRGPALVDFAYADFARSESARLDELRHLAIEERVEASLELGRHTALIGELEALVAEHPLRERLSGQLMLALYRSGRQAEALEAYAAARRRLVDELGIEPGHALQRLEKAILNQDPALDVDVPAPAPGPQRTAAPQPSKQTARRTVTVLFAEWLLEPVRTPTIDPETLEPVAARLVEGLRVAVERHGGSIEWSTEAEVIAVFGLVRIHEDDAFRAVRAAVDLRAAVDQLSERLTADFGVRAGVRIGLNTGPVIAGVSVPAPSLGGASSVAARLGRAASAGEIYLAESTRELVDDAVDVEPARVDGAPPATRLLAVVGETAGPRRRLSGVTVGREDELAALARAFDFVESERIASLVTVLGPAGIGKSHLARAFVDTLGDRSRVLAGRCPAYGEGNTFAPLAEIVRELGGEDPVIAMCDALAHDEDCALIVERISAAIGLSDAGGGSETTFWAVRRLFEALASDRPLVLVFDDLHWAEPTFLELVEYLLDWTFDAPVLLLGLSRPELLEDRPAWAGGKRNVSSLLLRPLTDAQAQALVDALPGGAALGPAQRTRIAEAGAGNPLFIEQMLAMQAGEGTGGDELAVPPTIQALLAARLDRLDAGRRPVLERASVIGKEFWRAALLALAPDDGDEPLGEALRELVRSQLIEPWRSSLLPGDALRFHSLLIRDAVYQSVPKRARAELHERVAAWLEEALGAQAGAHEELLGFHLEQSFRYTAELGPVDEHVRAVGRDAARRLSASGRRAFAGGDMSGAAGLLRRAAALLPETDADRLDLLPTAGEALHELGDFEGARSILDEAVRGAELRDDAHLTAKARLVRALVDASAGQAEPGATFVAEAEEAAALFERLGDDDGLATAFRMLAWAHGTAGRYGAAAEAALRAVDHAGRAGDERQRARAATQYALAALHGPVPATEAIARCRRIVDEVAGDRRSEGLVTSILGWLEAMRGDFGLARSLAGRARAILVDLGTSVLAASTSQESAQIEMLAGDPAAAERDLRRDFEALSLFGERYLLSTVAADLAEAVYAQGRLDAALELSRTAEELAAVNDVTSQAFWRSVRAKVEARRGRLAEAVPLADTAVEVLRRTDDLVALARVLVDRAEVLAADRQDDARASLEEALGLLERKENVVGARQVAALLERVAAKPVGAGS
jgi:DNA-binding SARP family transcriptional activator